jgi:hypothetical protein
MLAGVRATISGSIAQTTPYITHDISYVQHNKSDG